MNVIKFRTLLISIVAVLIVLAASLYAAAVVRAKQAVHEWEGIGGQIGVQMNVLLGPETMSLGSAPGIGYARRPNRVRAAVMKMNQDAGCRYLHFGETGWSCEELVSIVSGLNLEYLGLDSIVDGDTCVASLAELHSIRTIGFGRTCPSYSGLCVLLRSSSMRSVRISVSRERLGDIDRRALLAEFGKRVSFD